LKAGGQIFLESDDTLYSDFAGLNF